MNQQIINGVILYRRPASSSCPKGAWFGQHHHTSWAYGGWVVWETGKEEIAYCKTAKEAKKVIVNLEKEVKP